MEWIMKYIILAIIYSLSNGYVKDLATEEVREEIISKDILFPDIVLKQAILETGWFTSYGATHRHNLFGFWNSKEKRYMEFDTWMGSVSYYKAWQDRKYKGGDYYLFLEEVGYAVDKSYTRKLKRIKT